MKAAVNETLASFETRSNAAITKLQSGAEQAVEAGKGALAAAGALQATAERYSWNATVSPDPALAGDMIVLTVQGLTKKFPILNVYSWDNKPIIRDYRLQESATTPGMYTHQFKADAIFEPGKTYTYIVNEYESGGVVFGSGRVESMSITAVAGLAAAAPEAERAAKQCLEAMQALESVLVSRDFVNIGLTLRNLQQSVDRLPQIIAKEGSSGKIKEALDEISIKLSKISGEEGMDFSDLLKEAVGDSPAIKDIRSKADNIQTVTLVLKKLFEAKFGGEDAPIVSTSLAAGSVIFRVIAVNPSRNKTQTTEVKNYLPLEVKPKDVMELGGLDLEYDSEKSIYYVYKKDLELSPGEVRVFEVEVEDIWFVPERTLTDLRKRTEDIMVRVEKTEYYQKAKEIADSIYTRLNEIVTSQADETVSRETHIGIYRQNMVTVEKIKEDIARLEKILATAGGPLAPEMLVKSKIKSESPSKTMTWIIIFIIIIFTGLLAAVLFFTWNRQARVTKEAIQAAKKSAFPGSGEEREGTEEKSIE
jgi:hypothetical protein